MISGPTEQVDPQFIDSPHGNRQSLKNAGMIPNFIEKKEYGRTPAYINKLKKERIAEQRRWEQEQQEIIRRREMMKLQDDERQSILDVSLIIFLLTVLDLPFFRVCEPTGQSCTICTRGCRC